MLAMLEGILLLVLKLGQELVVNLLYEICCGCRWRKLCSST